MASLYISPTGSGLKDGSSPENAGTLQQLSKFVTAAGPGGEVLIIADQGTYHPTGQISLTAGGTADAPVTIRGIDSAGEPMAADISGTRPENWTSGQSEGSELFRLLKGADNLSFEDLAIRNVGNGAFRIGDNISNLNIERVDASNVSRFIENNVSGTATSATVNGLTVRDVDVTGYSKGAIHLKYDSHDILIENVTGNAGGQSSGLYLSGVHLEGTTHDVVLRAVEMSNNQGSGTGSQYWNGDGFTTESGTYHIRFEDTVARGNSDAGYDLKSSDTVLIRALAEENNRSFRLWSESITLEDSTSRNPLHSGGIGDTAHVWLAEGADAVIRNFVFSDANLFNTLFDLSQGNAHLAVFNTHIPDVYGDLIWLLKGSAIEFASSNTGTSGNDLLTGTTGDDTLTGKGGNDTYIVNAAGDSVIEAADQGVDHVRSGLVKCTLGINLENLTYDGAGNFTGTGNAGANIVTGRGGNDILRGEDGTDQLYGGAGNDQLYGGKHNDVLSGGEGNDKLYGDANSDKLFGGAGNDTLTGAAGNDVLSGGAGRDILIGGQEKDCFVFDTAPTGTNPAEVDEIRDFAAAYDRIHLDHGVFSAAGGPGQLAEEAFARWGDMAEADDRIIYRVETGGLYYDANGGDRDDAQLIATLTTHPTDLTADEILLF